MAIQLSKGGRINLSKSEPGLQNIDVKLTNINGSIITNLELSIVNIKYYLISIIFNIHI